MSNEIPYRRILLKLSGEKLSGQGAAAIDFDCLRQISRTIIKLWSIGIQVAVVLGGGNVCRGFSLSEQGMDRISADYMGMLATMINGLALQESLIREGNAAVVMSALDCPRIAESFNQRRAIQYLKQGQTLIFVGGTGNPYFTTDTAAAMRASEIQADALLKATKVDGIYNGDPLTDPKAIRYKKMDFSQLLADDLAVMDATAVALCRSQNIPLLVFNMQRLSPEGIVDSLLNMDHGTVVT